VGDSEKAEMGDQRVTVRDRDSMQQLRVPMAALETVFQQLFDGVPWERVATDLPITASR
jgi:glycyl-tRNA synthetase (class II)